MPIANCKRCGRIFNRVRRDICSDCIAEEEKLFLVVRNFIREHRDANIEEVSTGTGVDVNMIIDMIKDGRIILRDNPNITYSCERCGKPTRIGRYCNECTKELTSTLTQARQELKNKSTDQGKGYFSRH